MVTALCLVALCMLCVPVVMLLEYKRRIVGQMFKRILIGLFALSALFHVGAIVVWSIVEVPLSIMLV